MTGNILTEIFLPVALIIIMLGMGLSLTIDDFQQITIKPKAVFIGLFCQLIFLPLVAFLLVSWWSLNPEIAVGIMLLSACPGGATSNLFTYLAEGDKALSIALTAISSFLTIFSLPFVINFSLNFFMGDEQYITLPVGKTILQIFVITIFPVIIGMMIRAWKSNFAYRAEKPVKIASSIFIFIVILGAILNSRNDVLAFFQETGLPTLILNIITLVGSLIIPRIMGLNFRQSSTISIEAGIQNGTLAITIASSANLLNNPTIAIAPAIYSLIMFATGALASYLYGKQNNIKTKPL